MSLLDRLERILGRLAVPNMSLFIVIGQAFVVLATMLKLLDPERLLYAPVLFLHGQWWGIVTFLIYKVPPQGSGLELGYVWLVFAWYLFYLMGSALEGYWGVFRYNVFLFLSWALTVGFAFVTPEYAVTNFYIMTSVFLAFAYLNPDFELILFFVLPVKIKWLAMITWLVFAYSFVIGENALRLQIAAPVITFLVFFGADLLRSRRAARQTAKARTARVREEAEPRHVCHVCGKTDVSNPELDFRYCSKCAGDQCYCPEHIHTHAHVVAPENGPGQ